MTATLFDILPMVIALAVVLTALSIPPAQLAARSVLRQVVQGQTVRARAPSLLVGLGSGAALAVILVGITLGPNASFAVALLLLLTLLATIDFAWRWLPWEWCALLAIVGGAEAVLRGAYEPALLGALLGGGILLTLRTTFLVLRGVEAMGLGDVWLAAAIGTIVGPTYIMWLLGAAACLGLLLHFAAWAPNRADRGVAFGAHICIVTPFFVGL
ncbi:MAG: prepilin peptidase [Pseudomonadota bacterium]